jgi:predicted permease
VFGELLAIVAPIYIAIGLGYGWGRAGRRWDTELITDLIMTIGAPCLVFSSLVGTDIGPGAMLEMALATLAAFATFAVVGAGVLRLSGLSVQTFLAPIVFPNAGNMGLPVALFAFGQEGLALGIAFYAVASFTQYSAGIWIWSGRVSGGALLRTPLTWSVVIATTVMVLEAPVPGWIFRTTELLGAFTIPLMQFSLGVSLYRLELSAIPRSVALSLLRLGLGLVVGAGLAELFGLTGAARGVLILDCSMPVAVLNYLLAERYQRSPEDVASLVVLSTLLSLITLPLILAWVL